VSNRGDSRRWAKEKVEQLAPRGSRARAALTSGRAAALEARGLAARSRWRWRWSRSPSATTPTYLEWLDARRPGSDELAGERARVNEANIRIGVHVMIVGEGDVGKTVVGLKRQTFPAWTATVAGGRAPLGAPRSVSGSGSEAEGLAAAVAEGDPDDLVLVLEAGDVPEPDFVFNVAARGWDNPGLALVSWDDDLIDEDGLVHDPLFRPSWSPDTLLSANYLGRSFAVRRRRLQAADGFGKRAGDARWWDLLLRLDLAEEEVTRVPRVLVHQRRRPRVEAAEGAELVAERLRAAGREAEVSVVGDAVRVAGTRATSPAVSIVIPTRSRETLLAACLASLDRTDYAGAVEVVVVDSGARSPAAERWYGERSSGKLRVEPVWWEGPFNYSAANNLGAREASGEVLLFLNDDVEVVSPDWLSELVGWVSQPGVGLAGLRLLHGDGTIQHGGVVVGMTGFGGHLFAGMRPGEETIFGSTDWYRDCLSVTAACVAIERPLFEQIGGFDGRFVLCGSDVVLGLDARFHGRRSVVSPFVEVRHLESETRGENVPVEDFFSSYWRYQRWLKGGDPYFSPALSLRHTRPQLRGPGEPTALESVGAVLGRSFSVFRQTSTEKESEMLANSCRADAALEEKVRAGHAAVTGTEPPRTVNWFLPEIDNPFYGGINTALRIANKLHRDHGVANQFVIAGAANEPYIRSAIDAAFPDISDSLIAFSNGAPGPNLESMPAADASIATQWHTAYLVANFPHTKRRFYLIQDFEPMFYPAGTNYALAEESYRLGLYGLCNTEHMRALYARRYGGAGMSFMPAVDGTVFNDADRGEAPERPVTIFTYARPGHWRNCWELASPALTQVKENLGQGVRIVTAGSWAHPDDLGRGIEHLGLLDYRDTGKLYRQCDLGLALTVSEHPSYLPLELLSCGAPVVAFDNPAGDWIVHHDENSIRCPQTIDGLAEGLELLATDAALRKRLAAQGRRDIEAGHGDWDAALAGIYDYLSDPDASS
jgi:GT2 family glycosyltransferase/glycosyltransferase involved in cell wall biosynthesis